MVEDREVEVQAARSAGMAGMSGIRRPRNADTTKQYLLDLTSRIRVMQRLEVVAVVVVFVQSIK